METRPVSMARNTVYHILPGMAVTLLFLLLSAAFPSPHIPRLLLFYVSALAMLPVMLPIMKRHSPTGMAMGSMGYREKLPLFKMIALALVAMAWAALVMMAGRPIGTWLIDNAFPWMKPLFDFSAGMQNQPQYTRPMVVLTWVVGLATSSTLLPIAEELYFRGFLLRQMDKQGIAAVFISALLFSLYHLFSPWMVVARFVALLPMTYFIWKHRDIRIGILCHVLLNLVGDSLSSIPAVFS